MINDLILHPQRRRELIVLLLFSFFCLCCSLFRYVYTATPLYLFLNWNLFLACIPWVLTTLFVVRPYLIKKRYVLLATVGAWMLFFPNAPYILTDLFHLNNWSTAPIWFDLILILSFAWTGLMFGMLSLWDIEMMLNKYFNPIFSTILCNLFLFVSGFGIYLGRFLRWNSWDIINHPFQVISDVSQRMIHPFKHPQTWGVTISVGLFLCMVYWTFRYIRSRQY